MAPLDQQEPHTSPIPAGTLREKAKQAVLAALAYTFGALFLVLALAALIDSPLAALCMAGVGAVVFPPLARRIRARLGSGFTVRARTATALTLIVGFTVAAGTSDEAEPAESRVQDVERMQEEFEERRGELIATLRSHLVAGNYHAALGATNRFASADDAEFQALRDSATTLYQTAEAERRYAHLVEHVKTLPASDLEGNFRAYEELAGLRPDNTLYRERLATYAARKERAAKEASAEAAARAERLAYFGEKPVGSAWDGSYRVVKDYLKSAARDPDSVEIDSCTGVLEAQEGWVVGCDWRARNGFGGMNRESNWFVVRQGRVVEMKSAGAYRQ